jgi:hypothetical protein
MKDDPTIERIRKARCNISETHGHDPERLIRYYMQLQQQYKQTTRPSGTTRPRPIPEK